MAMWLADAPEPRYARSEDGYVAYQVFGTGPRDLLLIGNWASNIEIMWEHPGMARYLERLGRFARVICFDKRGVGLSDPVPLGALPTLEQWVPISVPPHGCLPALQKETEPQILHSPPPWQQQQQPAVRPQDVLVPQLWLVNSEHTNGFGVSAKTELTLTERTIGTAAAAAPTAADFLLNWRRVSPLPFPSAE